MLPKQLSYAITGAIIGFILGIFAGFGFVNYNTTKGQGGKFTFGIVLVVGIGFAIGGLLMGARIGEDAFKEQALGIDKVQEGMFKAGRYWTAMTSWIDPKTGKEVKLITAKNDEGTLVSVIGEKTIMNHKTKSGSGSDVSGSHEQARDLVFMALKCNYGNGKGIEDIFIKEL